MTLVPQTALAVCLIADGVLGSQTHDPGAGDTHGRVELEIITPATSDVIAIDTPSAGIVTTARRIITHLSAAWHHDTEFRPVPGQWCAACPVARWCPDAANTSAPTIVIDGVTIDARTGEVLSAPGGLTARAEAVTGVLAEPPADDDPTV